MTIDSIRNITVSSQYLYQGTKQYGNIGDIFCKIIESQIKMRKIIR